MATSEIKSPYTFSYNTLLDNTEHTTGLDEYTLLDNLSNYNSVCIIVGNNNRAVHNSITIPKAEFLSHVSNSNLIRLKGDSDSNYILLKAKNTDGGKVYIQTAGTATIKILGIR